MSAFTYWLEEVQALIGDLTSIIADADMLSALRLWHKRGWSAADAADALQDSLAGL